MYWSVQPFCYMYLKNELVLTIFDDQNIILECFIEKLQNGIFEDSFIDMLQIRHLQNLGVFSSNIGN